MKGYLVSRGIVCDSENAENALGKALVSGQLVASVEELTEMGSRSNR